MGSFYQVTRCPQYLKGEEKRKKNKKAEESQEVQPPQKMKTRTVKSQEIQNQGKEDLTQKFKMDPQTGSGTPKQSGDDKKGLHNKDKVPTTQQKLSFAKKKKDGEKG